MDLFISMSNPFMLPMKWIFFVNTIIKNQDRRKYILALNQADNADFYPFLEFVADSLINTSPIIISELKQFKK